MGRDKSPFYVKQQPLTRADELRDQLAQLESKVGRLGHGLGREALTIPPLFDEVSATLAELGARGQSMRGEKARLEAASAELRRKAVVFLREIGGVSAMQEARRARQSDTADWWWFPDRLVAHKRRARLRRLIWAAAGVAAVLLLLVALYQRLLAPDPATRERLQHQQAAERLAQEGDLAGALSEVEGALTVAPGDPNLLIFRGVIQREMGQSRAAEETFAAAQVALGDREAFLIARGQTYLFLGQVEAAMADAEAVIGLNPESATGYLLLARANQALEHYEEAIAAYEQAATLADAQGDFNLAATARVNMGILTQRLQAP